MPLKKVEAGYTSRELNEAGRGFELFAVSYGVVAGNLTTVCSIERNFPTTPMLMRGVQHLPEGGGGGR